MKLAIVGCTGLVGVEVLNVLTELSIPIKELILVASEKNIGKKVEFKFEEINIVSIQEAIHQIPDIAIFCAGSEVSKKWAQKFVDSGTNVIDNSSFFRMEENIPLVVPEVNGDVLKKSNKIIANPNCSTIQLVMTLSPLHLKYKMKRVVISTYQSVSGTGVKAVQQLENEEAGIKGEMVYPHPIGRNALPHCDVFLENGYTKEEMKLVKEPKKILRDNTFSVTATAVRIPTAGGHSEAVNVQFMDDFEINDVRKLLSETPGVVVQDDVKNNLYPMPITAHQKDEVFVGRIRRDESQENSLNLWIVSDNLRKGAATNAVQIAEYLVENKIV
jgi:aspartate-semialdehyde dehydrogenase